jgi:hypothetical protein
VAVTAFVLPPLLLCIMLALGRYEERMLGEAGPESGAGTEPSGRTSGERHLRAVPDLPPHAPSESTAPHDAERAA